MTVLNFSGQENAGTVRSEMLEPEPTVTDASISDTIGAMDDLFSFHLQLGP